MKTVLSTLILLVVLSDPSHAQYYSRGAGNDSCGAVVAAFNEDGIGKGSALERFDGKWFRKNFQYTEWVQGYLTGLNMMDATQSKQIKVDWPGVEVWLRKWCQTNPTKSLHDAVATFALEHWKK